MTLLERIAELEQLSEKATPDWRIVVWNEPENAPILLAVVDGRQAVVYRDNNGVSVDHNLNFIAASRNAIPELCTAVREMVEFVDSIETCSGDLCVANSCFCDGMQARALLAKYGIEMKP